MDIFVDLSHKMGIIDAKFSDQAHGLEGMKNRLQKEESTREQSIACSRLLKQQHRELLQQQKQIMQHISHVSATQFMLSCKCPLGHLFSVLYIGFFILTARAEPWGIQEVGCLPLH